jgi:uncharacterized membrane protein YhaH (DUF805 family)
MIYIFLVALAVLLIWLAIYVKFLQMIGKAILWCVKRIWKIIKFIIYKIRNKNKKDDTSSSKNGNDCIEQETV